MKLSEVLKQDEVTLTVGNYLASITEEAGYVSSHKHSTSIHHGRYLFKIIEDGESTNIIPIVTSDDGKEVIEDRANPIIVIQGSTVSYTTGRNHTQDKDVYKGRQLHFIEDIEEGEVHRVALLSFLEFVESEYTLGVNDFRMAEAEEIEDEDAEEEEEGEPTEPTDPTDPEEGEEEGTEG